MALSSVISGYVQRLKGSKVSDSANSLKSARMDQYGGFSVVPSHVDLMGLNEEGSVFVATNPTLDTAVATTTSITTYAETAGAVGVVLMLRNTDPVSDSSRRMIMLSCRLMIVQVPTSATSWKAAWVLDDNPVRYTSGGSVITTIYNANGDASNATCAAMYFGALTTAVPTNKRVIARSNLRGVIPTTFDEYLMTFGWGSNGAAISAAASGGLVKALPPCIIKPQQNLCLTLWGASNAAAPSYEFEVVWAER